MKKINTDRILAYSAILISVMTLVTFIYQTNIVNKQSKLSVTPRLSFSTVNNRTISTRVDDSTKVETIDTIANCSLILINKGIGPAIIRSVKIIDREKVYDLNVEEFFKTAYPEISNFILFTQMNTRREGSALAVNEEIILFSFKIKDAKSRQLKEYLNVEKLTNRQFPFNIEIVYSSMYEETWKIESKINKGPKKIN